MNIYVEKRFLLGFFLSCSWKKMEKKIYTINAILEMQPLRNLKKKTSLCQKTQRCL